MSILYYSILKSFKLTSLPCLMLSSQAKTLDDTQEDPVPLIFLSVIWSDTLMLSKSIIQDAFYLILPFPDPEATFAKIEAALISFTSESPFTTA